MDRIRCAACIVIACAATSGCGLILGGNDMAWLHSPKIEPELREWLLAHPGERVDIVVSFRLSEPVGRAQEPSEEEQREYRAAAAEYADKLRAQRRGERVNQAELESDLRTLVRLEEAVDERRLALRTEWYTRRQAIFRKARIAGMRRLRTIPDLEYVGPATELVPLATLRVTAEQIAALVDHRDIVGISKVVYYTGALDVSHRAVGANTVHAAGNEGVGQRIVIFDSGIHNGTLLQNLQHPAIQGIGAGLHGNYTQEPNEFDQHPTMHGTGVAGVAASRDPGGGASPRTGVAPAATLVNAKVLDGNLQGGGPALVAAAEWALDPTLSADVFNTSFASPGTEGTGMVGNELYIDMFITGAPHIVWAQAAGNTGLDPDPEDRTVRVAGGAWNVITTSAFDDNNALDESQHAWLPQSSSGPVAGRKKPDVCAPGTRVLAPYTAGPNDHQYLERTGTSFATPHVAGVAALVRATPFPPFGMQNVDEGMFVKAIIINAATPPPTRALGAGAKLGHVAPGNWDGQWGWGKLNAQRAVDMAANAWTRVHQGALQQTSAPYKRTVQPGPGVDAVSVTLCYDREVNLPPTNVFEVIADRLDLKVFRSQGGTRTLVHTDNSADNVKKVTFSVHAGHTYEVEVQPAPGLVTDTRKFALVSTEALTP